MRAKLSILSFVLALTVGICFDRLDLMKDRLTPSFTRDESAHKVGERVRHYQSEKFTLMKCLDDKPCVAVSDGEHGTVIGIEPVPAGGYFLKVRWDHPAENYISYFSRYTYRESLVERSHFSQQHQFDLPLCP